jgi:hypothetical protein
MKAPWVPRYCRDLARDCIDPATLPDEIDPRVGMSPRQFYLKFLDEHYNATPQGIGTVAHIREAGRRKQSARVDVFSAGLRASADMPEVASVGVTAATAALESPAAQALLKRLRAVRPEFDGTDGRRRARFKSQRAERLFYQLRAQLAALLETHDQ